jgi:hypothetical protein
LQSALFLLEVAAGFTVAFFEAQQLFASPAAAGFAFALLAQQLFASPAAAGFAFAAFAAIGQAGVPASGQPASALLHFAGSQFVASQLLRSHCALVAAALIFSVLLQPYAAKPMTAMRLIVNTFFILFSPVEVIEIRIYVSSSLYVDPVRETIKTTQLRC